MATFEESSVMVTKARIPVFDIGLNEKLDDSTCTVLESKTLTTSTFTFRGSYTKYGEFLDGRDGYWYGFSNEPSVQVVLNKGVPEIKGSSVVIYTRVLSRNSAIFTGYYTRIT